MIKVNVEVKMFNTLKVLDGMSDRSKNFRKTFEYARRELSKANAENFTTGGLPVGGWQPRQQPAGWPLMRKTGELMTSLVDLRGAPNEIRPTSATFGTDVEHAVFHQQGTTRMPSRQIVFEPIEFARGVADHAAGHIMGTERYFAR